jgi:ribulose-phosphate 3-epimerase
MVRQALPSLRHRFLRDRSLFINPSLLSADFARLEKELKAVAKANCPMLHLDVMDGHFVPNLTFGPPVVKALSALNSGLFLDTHLMIAQPARYIEAFVKAGSHLVTVHVESEGCAADHLDAIRELGAYTGVSIKPRTPVEAIAGCLGKADLVLVMTVEPGFGGQALIPSTLGKVRDLARLREEHGYRYAIEVDGGINRETAHLAASAGAEILVAGSAVFGPGGVPRNVRLLQEAAFTQ